MEIVQAGHQKLKQKLTSLIKLYTRKPMKRTETAEEPHTYRVHVFLETIEEVS